MIPLRITARNLRTFRELDLEIPSGCTVISGPNRAGKSTLANAPELALFGPPAGTLADYLADDAAEPMLEVCLEFAHRGERYRVRRTFTVGQPARLDLERGREDEEEKSTA